MYRWETMHAVVRQRLVDIVRAPTPEEAATAGMLDARAALPQAPPVSTGGVTQAEAAGWTAAGAVACGMGASLISGGPVGEAA